MVLHRLGLTTSDAINLLYRQICFHRRLPFPVEIPNEETRKAIAEPIKNARRFKTVDELFRDLNSDDRKQPHPIVSGRRGMKT